MTDIWIENDKNLKIYVYMYSVLYIFNIENI